MCALRAIPIPESIEKKRSEINPGLSAIAGINAGISAVPILPNPAALTRHLSITQFATEPNGLSETHHHGDLDTCVYVIKGTLGFKCGVGMNDYVAMREGELHRGIAAIREQAHIRTRCRSNRSRRRRARWHRDRRPVASRSAPPRRTRRKPATRNRSG